MKHKCVLGVYGSCRGLLIRDQMRTWLDKAYDVTEVQVEPPNDVLFEEPFLRKACEVALESGEPVLYLHTKGAAMYNPVQCRVRDFWKWTFGEDGDRYFALADKEVPTCSSWFGTEEDPCCWYNGFVMNVPAARAILNVLNPHKDRYWFERGLFEEAGVQVACMECTKDSGEQTVKFNLRYWSVLYERAGKEGKRQTVVCMPGPDRRQGLGTCARTMEDILEKSNPAKLVLALDAEEYPAGEQSLPDAVLDLFREGRIVLAWLPSNVYKFGLSQAIRKDYPNFPVMFHNPRFPYDKDYEGELYLHWSVYIKKVQRVSKSNVLSSFGLGPNVLYSPLVCLK